LRHPAVNTIAFVATKPITYNVNDVFIGNLTQQELILDEGIAAALAVLQHVRIHHYNESEGEAVEAAMLGKEFAAQVGAKHRLAVASGGYALVAALRVVGVKSGDKVLTNAFKLAPVSGAIASVGAEAVFVGVAEG
tara:strand:+ start:17877 stop:18284 length:408 start_codon:yes stop_codon:yes gene_type:complete